MDITVLGMGRMGQALAGRLAGAGHQVTIWNRTPGQAAEVVAAGAREAPTLGDAVAGAALVITSLSNDEAVRAVALGAGGVGEALEPGAAYLDASTISPQAAQEVADAIDAFAAMPILGPPAGVASGGATYLLGGAAAATEVADQVLPDLTTTVRRYAHAAQASAAKLTANTLLLDAVVALAEAFAVGRAGGLSDDQLRELLVDTPLVAPVLANRFEGVLTGTQEAWWSTALGAKDAGLAAALAATDGRALPATTATRDQMARAASEGPDGADIATVTALYRDPSS